MKVLLLFIARREQFKIPSDKMAINPYMRSDTNSHAYRGLRGNNVVTVNGESPNLVARAFLACRAFKGNCYDKK